MYRARAKKFKRGFTLAEMLTVVAILAILASIIAPVTLQYISQTQERADEVYTSDIAKMADNCAISLNSRGVIVDSQSVCAELESLYGSDIPYEIGYIPTGELAGTEDSPSFANVRGVTEGVNTFIAIYVNDSHLNVYMVKEGVEVTEQRQYRLIAA